MMGLSNNTVYDIDEDNVLSSSSLEDRIDSPSLAGGKNSNVHIVATEDTPLLHDDSRAFSTIPSVQNHDIETRWIVPIIFAIVLILQCGDQLMNAPLTRVYESIYCYQYWEQHDPSKLLMGRSSVGPGAIGGVEESLCKLPEIQGNVAQLEGNWTFFYALPSLFLAIPFGILADRWGRKPIIIMGLFSFPLAALWIEMVCWFWQIFDIRLIYLSSLHGLCGGSSTVISAVVNTVFADVVREEHRATTFFQVTSCTMLMNVLAPPVAAYLMTINPWISIFLGTLLEIMAIPMMFYVPETLHYSRRGTASKLSTQHSVEPSKVIRWTTPLKEMGAVLIRDWRVPALASSFLLHIYTSAIAALLMLQYVSTRFEITFSRATLVVALRSGFSIVVLLLMLPWLSHFMITCWGYDSKRKDITLARGSALIAGLGWILLALAPTLPLFVVGVFVMVLGSGFPHLVRSFLTSLVPPTDVAKLYTILSVLDTVGLMGASPLFAWLFKVGLSVGGNARGLPFLVLGAVHVVFAGITLCVWVREGDNGEPVEDDDIFEP